MPVCVAVGYTGKRLKKTGHCTSALHGVDALVLAVRHEPYLKLAPDKVVRSVGHPFALIDCFCVLNGEQIRRYLELGCEVKGMGRGHIKRIKDSHLQVIEGVRHTGVDAYLRKKFGGSLKLVYVNSPFAVPFQRALAVSPGLTSEDFRAQDEAPIEQGTLALREMADVVLINERGLSELRG